MGKLQRGSWGRGDVLFLRGELVGLHFQEAAVVVRELEDVLGVVVLKLTQAADLARR